ncbi:GSCOCG00005537001-RA-CDS [Cotesia congregata]|nr:GSCOCG00005537001-RA-CDS [Cotesia congregata]
MIQYIVLAVLIGSACSAPAAEPNPAPHHGTHEAHGIQAHGTQAHEAPAHESPAHEPIAIEAVEHELNDAPISSAHEEHPGHPGHIGHSGHGEHGSGPSPVPAAKQLLIAEYPLLKTPASTGKLTPVATSFVAPIPPLTYAAAPAVLTSYPAWSGLAALPATYSIEQHGYHITY